MNILLRDIQFGLRTLLRRPLFALVATCTLALGIGANTAVFSVIDAVLLRPLPYPHPEQLVIIRSSSDRYPLASVAYPDYLDWRAGQRTLTDLAIMRRSSYNLSYGKSGAVMPERIAGDVATANYLPVMGITPRMGRNFTEEEDTPGGPRAVILTDALWRRRFGADPAVVGRRLTLDGVSREIVGVLPPTPSSRSRSELLVPLGEVRLDPVLLARENEVGFSGYARLKPGVTLTEVNADLNNIARELARRYPKSNAGRRIDGKPLLEYSVGKYRQGLYTLLAAVGCVLLIACANVANLQLARTAAREKELAVRAALGATRARLLSQMLTESALLGLLGGAAGVLLALWAVDAIVALSPADAMRFRDTHLDWRALVFTTVAALVAGVAAGVWPAWRISTMAAMAAALREGGGRGGTDSAGQHRTRSLLVVIQVALAVVLLTGAGLTLKSFWRSQNEPVGFDPEKLLSASISLPAARYDTEEKQVAFFGALLDKVRALPGVQFAGLGVNDPFDKSDWETSFHLTGTPPNPPNDDPSAELNTVSPDYFKTMKIGLVRGRYFGPEDVLGQTRTAIIDEEFARRYFPGRDPVGQLIDTQHGAEVSLVPTLVVGVVKRTRNNAPNENPVLEGIPQLHFPLTQYPARGIQLVVRVVSGDPMRLAESIRRSVLSLDEDLPISEVASVADDISASLASQRMNMALLGVFSGLALALASIGLYGVMALSVSQRTRELGIRLALGAQRLAVVGLIMRQGAQLVGLGLAAGLAGALALGRILASVLYGINGTDLAILCAVTAALAGASLLACWLPARRATRVDPMEALRSE